MHGASTFINTPLATLAGNHCRGQRCRSELDACRGAILHENSEKSCALMSAVCCLTPMPVGSCFMLSSWQNPIFTIDLSRSFSVAVWIILGVLAGIAVIVVIFVVGIYNQLVTLKKRFENAFSQIEVQLKRRYDLIPNLVETVKGYMAHERDTLEAVIKARNQAVTGLQQASSDPQNAAAMQALAGAEQGLTGALGKLFALSEAYPDLKANQNMAQLTEEITTTENKVAFARQAYNDSVTAYNTYKETFPPVVFAGMFGHSQDGQLLQFDSATIAEAPKVSFN